MRVLLVSYIAYCGSPLDRDLYVDILTDKGLDKSMKGSTDACRIGIVYHVLIEICTWTYSQRKVFVIFDRSNCCESHWYCIHIMYCMSPHDKYLCVDIFTENGLAESMTGPTDACLIGIIYHVLNVAS